MIYYLIDINTYKGDMSGMAEKYKVDQYSIYEHGREYRVLVFPEFQYAWAYDDYPEEDQYRVDGDKEFYSALMHALAILIADPWKVIYFPIKKVPPAFTITKLYDDFENYHLVLTRPELQFRASRWFDLKGRLDRNHQIERYGFRYDGKKLNDYFVKYWDSRLRYTRPCYRPDRKDYVEKLLGDTVFLTLPREVCYVYHDSISKELSHIYAGERDSELCAQEVGIGWIWQDMILPENKTIL